MDILVEKNIMVPMRDGVELATDVYRPVEEGQFPVLLARLPYNKEPLAQVAQSAIDAFRAVQQRYVVVFQDCRGRFASEGAFSPAINEASDGVDTIDWIIQQPWASDQVGMVGGSYLGFTQWLLAKEHPEALRALAPVVTTANFYQAPFRHQGGVLDLGCALSWSLGMVLEELQRRLRQGRASQEQMGAFMQMMRDPSALFEHLPLTDQPLLREFAPFYLEWLAHPTYDDYWRSIAPGECYEHITVPALNVGGWYDLFLGTTLANYTGMKQRGGSAVARAHQRLVIGPWSHMNWTGVFPERAYGLAASGDAVDLVGMQLRWYDHWLKGEENGVEQDKPVKLFVMGLDQWRDEEDWPLPDTQFRPYYLHSAGHANSATGNGTLSTQAPTDEPEDVYLYHPRNPVPTTGGAILLGLTPVEGPRDQRAVEAREDVLCYSTPVLEKPVEVTGPIALVLYVSSSARDTDFTGKLVDVSPDGRAEILTDGILRARYREPFTEPKLLEPGQTYKLHLDLWATSNLFQAGHRIRLEVSSSNFPRFDRNTNTGGTIETETEQDFVPAVNRIYHERAYPSHLILPIIERDRPATQGSAWNSVAKAHTTNEPGELPMAVYQNPELLSLFDVYTGGPTSIGADLTRMTMQAASDDPLIVVTKTDMALFPGGGAAPSVESFRLSTRGFKELAAVSHLGPALATLVNMHAIDPSSEVWRQDAERLLASVVVARAANAEEVWRESIAAEAYKGREKTIAAMIDYACAVTVRYLKTVLADDAKLTSEYLRKEYLEAAGSDLGATIPVNAVMIATFFLTGLDIAFRITRWFRQQAVDWSRAMVLISGKQGRPTSGVTLTSNSVCQMIIHASELSLPLGRIYIAPHAPSFVLSDPVDLEAVRALEEQYRFLWCSTWAISQLGATMFDGYPRYAPGSSVEPVIDDATRELSEMPRILGPDDMRTMTTRLRLVLEDPRQLLSGSVTDYAASQLRETGNNPAAVVVPGLDGYAYPTDLL